jgi:hypothetical protein
MEHPPTLSLLTEYATEAYHASFYQTSFKTAPWFQIPFGTSDNLQHALPEGFQMSQPRLGTSDLS